MHNLFSCSVVTLFHDSAIIGKSFEDMPYSRLGKKTARSKIRFHESFNVTVGTERNIDPHDELFVVLSPSASAGNKSACV